MRYGSSSFKISHDPENERLVFREMCINMELYNDKLPVNEELAGRVVLDNFATDRSASLDEVRTGGGKGGQQ